MGEHIMLAFLIAMFMVPLVWAFRRHHRMRERGLLAHIGKYDFIHEDLLSGEYTLRTTRDLAAATMLTRKNAMGAVKHITVRPKTSGEPGEGAVTLRSKRRMRDVALPGYANIHLAPAQVGRALEWSPERLDAFHELACKYDRNEDMGEGATVRHHVSLHGTGDDVDVVYESSYTTMSRDMITAMRQVTDPAYLAHTPRRVLQLDRWDNFLRASTSTTDRLSLFAGLTYGLAPERVHQGEHDDLILEAFASYDGVCTPIPGAFAVLAAILWERAPESEHLEPALAACSGAQLEAFVRILEQLDSLEPHHVTLLHLLRSLGHERAASRMLEKAQGAGDLSLAQSVQGGEVTVSEVGAGRLEQVDEVVLGFDAPDEDEAHAEADAEVQAEG